MASFHVLQTFNVIFSGYYPNIDHLPMLILSILLLVFAYIWSHASFMLYWQTGKFTESYFGDLILANASIIFVFTESELQLLHSRIATSNGKKKKKRYITPVTSFPIYKQSTNCVPAEAFHISFLFSQSVEQPLFLPAENKLC